MNNFELQYKMKMEVSIRVKEKGVFLNANDIAPFRLEPRFLQDEKRLTGLLNNFGNPENLTKIMVRTIP